MDAPAALAQPLLPAAQQRDRTADASPSPRGGEEGADLAGEVAPAGAAPAAPAKTVGPPPSAAAPAAPDEEEEDATGGAFDCNVCYDVAREPVVTLCGHLYCWPCLYR